MSWLWRERREALERMDTEPLTPPDASRVLTDLERINRLLGGTRATLLHFERFAKRWKAGERIRILDWGTGGADIPRALVRWALRHGLRLEVTGIDQNPAIVAEARRRCENYPEIQIIEADAATWPDPPHPFDYVISSLTLHHLDGAAIVQLLRRSDRLARRGIVMNDLIRSARAWAWIWALSRVTGMHPMVRHDGPLSVERAFTDRELGSYARQAEVSYLKVEKHFGYRMTLAGEKA